MSQNKKRIFQRVTKFIDYALSVHFQLFILAPNNFPINPIPSFAIAPTGSLLTRLRSLSDVFTFPSFPIK